MTQAPRSAAEISFTVTPAERDLLAEIADRQFKMETDYAKENGYRVARGRRVEILMDLTAMHANGTPLRLADLLAADEFNFAHDTLGIARHLDRTTGRLTGHFSPRFSAPLAA